MSVRRVIESAEPGSDEVRAAILRSVPVRVSRAPTRAPGRMSVVLGAGHTDGDVRTLGAREVELVRALGETGADTVDVHDVMWLLDAPHRRALYVIRRLVLAGWLERIGRGLYRLRPLDPTIETLDATRVGSLAEVMREPWYLGWWTAAKVHGLTTSRTPAMTVGLPKVTPPVVTSTRVRFVTLVPSKLFGWGPIPLFGYDVPVSSMAKTIVDCLERPDLAGGLPETVRIVEEGLRRVAIDDLVAVVARSDRKIVQRLGFVADLVGWEWPEGVRAQWHARLKQSKYRPFGRRPPREGDIGRVRAWRLLVGASRAELLGEERASAPEPQAPIPWAADPGPEPDRGQLGARATRVIRALREQGRETVLRLDVLQLGGGGQNTCDRVVQRLLAAGWLARVGPGVYRVRLAADADGDPASPSPALGSRVPIPWAADPGPEPDRRQLGARATRVIRALREQGCETVLRPDVLQLVGGGQNTCDRVVQRLLAAGWLARVGRGVYRLRLAADADGDPASPSPALGCPR